LLPLLGHGLPWPQGSLSSYAIRASYLTELTILGLYLVVCLKVVHQAATLRQPVHKKTRGWLLLCYAIRAVPAACVISSFYSFGGGPLPLTPSFRGGGGGGSAGGDDAFCNNPGSMAVGGGGLSEFTWLMGYPSLNQQTMEGGRGSNCSSNGGVGGVGVMGGIFRAVVDGVFVSIWTSDMIVCKMADRQLHPLLALLTLVSTLGPLPALACVLLYYFTLAGDISGGLNIPMLNPVLFVVVFSEDPPYRRHLSHASLLRCISRRKEILAHWFIAFNLSFFFNC
jgi:hypothetical protein